MENVGKFKQKSNINVLWDLRITIYRIAWKLF